MAHDELLIDAVRANAAAATFLDVDMNPVSHWTGLVNLSCPQEAFASVRL